MCLCGLTLPTRLECFEGAPTDMTLLPVDITIHTNTQHYLTLPYLISLTKKAICVTLTARNIEGN
jgi:hypothetical protein